MTQANTSTPNLTLRLLNGMLSGVEFSLTSPRTLFCVGNEQTFEGMPLQSDSLAQETLFIPSAQPSANFAVDISTFPAMDGDFRLDIYQDPTHTESCFFQRPCQAGMLCFSIKPAGDSWHNEILNFEMASPLLQDKKRSSKWYKKGALALVLLLVCMLGCGLGWHYFKTYVDQQQQVSLSTLLEAPEKSLVVKKGRDHVFYVLAPNESAAAWARQTLARARRSQTIRVLSLAQEQERIGQWLDQHKTAYFVLRFDNPRTPTLVLSLERSREVNQAALRQDLLNAMPYVDNLLFSWQSDMQVLAQAQNQLDQLALSYQRLGDAAQGFVLVLERDIDDGVLSQLRPQRQQFEQTYGNRYARLVLQMNEDWLKGKSYKYGADSYVQLSPQHRYFPQPLKARQESIWSIL